MILPPIHPYFLSISDDGKLSFEEFNAYFFICSSPLDYFSQHLGEYLNVLSALESLNIAILKAMDKTKEEYQGSSVLGQFVTRFMLRETSSQLLSLQRSLQCAMEAVEEQSVTMRCHTNYLRHSKKPFLPTKRQRPDTSRCVTPPVVHLETTFTFESAFGGFLTIIYFVHDYTTH
uniref:N-terminal EF-hand calcium binding protein 3 n=1 Tax=Amphilophus citrinellus TaxID=61819 RepID=A0A3Q0SAK7_AMPCI